MAAVRENVSAGGDGICRTEDSKQAGREEHEEEASGDVSSEEAAENLSLRRSLVHPTLKPKPI